MFFFIFGLEDLTDCDKIRCIFSPSKFVVQKCKRFHLAFIVSLLYLVKLIIRVLQVNSS